MCSCVIGPSRVKLFNWLGKLIKRVQLFSFSLVSNMVYSLHELKVDQSSFPIENTVLFVTNVNIPQRFIDNALPIIDRIKTFLDAEYVNIERVRYQVIATYQLINNVNGEVRQWSGSFMPGRNHPNSLQDFKHFDQDFVPQVLGLCDKNLIIAKIKYWNVNTKWQFHQLTSIVINVQGITTITNRILIHRNLNHVRRRRGFRNHTTFYLP